MTYNDQKYTKTYCNYTEYFVYAHSQAGMIITNIICRNFLTLIQMPADPSRSRLARLCLFQWYGMIAFMQMHIITQEADRRNEATSAVSRYRLLLLEVVLVRFLLFKLSFYVYVFILSSTNITLL